MTLRWFFTRSSRGNSRPRTHQSHVPIHRNALRGLEKFESRLLLAGDLAPRHNSLNPEDVNDDQQVTVMDALVVVDVVQGRSAGNQPRFADVDGDGAATPRDALRIVERLRQGAQRGQDRGGGDRRDRGQQTADLPPATLDGSNNNPTNPDFGAAGQALLRISAAEYADGVSAPAGSDRPGAREVSNAVAAQSEINGNEQGLSDLVWIWGQFVDHDLDLTADDPDGEDFSIDVAPGDPQFDPLQTGEVSIPLTRSASADGTGDVADNPRQQVNAISAFLDASVVYGSDEERALALRTLAGGRLRTSEGELLPFNEQGLENAGGSSDRLFLAGDIRANENVALTAMHTIWVREHNRVADEIAANNPALTDEEIFQQARSIVRAELQAITYNEFLPALLGGSLGPYQGYDADVNSGITNEFATAIYRFGHSMLSPELTRLDADGNPAEEGGLALAAAFFNPQELIDNGVDSLIRGAASQEAQEIDTQVVDAVRNFLFGPPGAGGLDLASLNIQRGRDHGLADYNQVRQDMGLEPIASFAEITSDEDLQQRLEELYGDVDNIDLWVGALAEDHVPGASVGELTQAVLTEQFERIRAGDQYWYENLFSGRELRDLQRTTLADVIQRNTEITGLQRNVFFV